MWELDHKNGWAPNNWCFWTVVLEKTLESPLDCKKIQPVHLKRNQSWTFIGRTDAEAPILWPPDVKNWLIRKDPYGGKDWRQEKKGTTEDKMIGIASLTPSNHLSSFVPFSRLQSFPASGSFLMSQFFTSDGQSIEASESVLPMNIQDWFPLGLTGLISLQTKGFSRVFSNTTVQKHQFFSAQLSPWSNSHIHTWLLEKL